MYSISNDETKSMRKTDILTLFNTARPAFLILTPACLLLGLGSAYFIQTTIELTDFIIILIGASAAHISVNTFNEHQDFNSGLDAMTQRTPFSGGSGALIANPQAADRVQLLALISLGITVIIGVYFVFSRGLAILPIGLIGIFVIITYTRWINRLPILCLIAPGISFGPLMVIGTHFALTGQFSITNLLASLIPFFLVNNLLLLNQFPDIDADKTIGRDHFPIRYGLGKSGVIFALFSIATLLTLLIGVQFKFFPSLALWALIPLGFSFLAVYGTIKYSHEITRLTPYMAANVIAAIATPAILGITLVLQYR
jgi:1,4-dihydroxy-2-naphthoate octaprenyltransferase